MQVTVAATQMACGDDRAANIACAEALVREVAGRGAQVVLVQELFETPCFCLCRKAHIPESPGYHENFYFSPGDTGFQVWPTRFGRLGAGICWDQWFPECARAMALLGQRSCSIPRPSVRSRKTPQSIHAGTGSAPCRATRRPT